jgi:hypothetical protein
MKGKITGFDKLKELLGKKAKTAADSKVPGEPPSEAAGRTSAQGRDLSKKSINRVAGDNRPDAGAKESATCRQSSKSATSRSTLSPSPHPTRPGFPTNNGAASRRGSTLDVIIGLDFGTRYTKVCYKFYGDERSAIAERKPGAEQGALWPSRIFIDSKNGTVHTTRTSSSSDLYELSYLKMRLKDPSAPEFGPHPRILSYLPRGSEHALAAFYLSTVIRQARAFIETREVARLKGRETRWQINLSIPAQYQDDGVAEVFRLVGEVALLWSGESNSAQPPSVSTLCERFKADAPKVAAKKRVEVFAEIVAALFQFIQRPDTPEGVHGFLDIGGGTLDGCVFRLIREKSGPRVNVLAAKVEPLGTVAVSKKALAGLYQNLDRSIEERIVTATGQHISVELPLTDSENCIQGFIGALMANARDRSPNRTLKQPTTVYSSDPTRLSNSDHFILRCSGGGSASQWYKRTIEGAYTKNNLAANGIMPFSASLIEPPSSFANNARTPFPRFVIAHGLSSPAEELELVRCLLPSQLVAAASLPTRQLKAVDYHSTKDLT